MLYPIAHPTRGAYLLGQGNCPKGGFSIMGKGISAEDFVAEHLATEKDVENRKAKRCTKHNCSCGNVPLKLEAFYNDKSNKKWGKSPWCKIAEASYGAKYNAALKATSAPKKRSITEDSDLETFESIMASERKPRKNVGVDANTEVPTEAETPTKSAPRKRAPRKKGTQVKSAA